MINLDQRHLLVGLSSILTSNIFISETAWPIKVKFYVEHQRVGGLKLLFRNLGRLTKMAVTLIYGKNHSQICSRTGRPISTKLSKQHLGLQPIIVCSNDDPVMTLTYFTARSVLET